ncbi:hypothetical protein [Streptomyces plumbiresistens]|uniref:Uncharacterized protein n=1 Tax=Streptomyces plumbiresistens TaxID=511811 RepID=A0ABP7RI32_9ACTN
MLPELAKWYAEGEKELLRGVRLGQWAEDFPAEGDQVIAALFAERPEWLGEYGHRQVLGGGGPVGRGRRLLRDQASGAG